MWLFPALGALTLRVCCVQDCPHPATQGPQLSSLRIATVLVFRPFVVFPDHLCILTLASLRLSHSHALSCLHNLTLVWLAHIYIRSGLHTLDTQSCAHSRTSLRYFPLSNVQVMPFSTACSTPLSNFEAGLNYKDVSDPAVMVSLGQGMRLGPGGMCVLGDSSLSKLPDNYVQYDTNKRNVLLKATAAHIESCAKISARVIPISTVFALISCPDSCCR